MKKFLSVTQLIFKIIKKHKFLGIIVCLFVAAILYDVSFKAPIAAVPDTFVKLEKGVGVTAIAEYLKEEEVIQSPFWFKAFSVLSGTHRSLVSGYYFINEPQSVWGVLSTLSNGEHNITPSIVTIPEGANINEAAILIDRKLPLFNRDVFFELLKEGYVFPDTYFFFPHSDTEEVVGIISRNFDEKIKHLGEDIEDSGYTLDEILTMASIIEEETYKSEDRPLVSSVLWNRISLGMALQVDVTFQYINGKNSYTLSKADLKEDSPYNTYTNRGLPPTPISNPGLDSIEAALFPAEDNDYLYFLSDRQGNIYFADDFEGHKQNRLRYLNK
jgi:UPF0755 protein